MNNEPLVSIITAVYNNVEHVGDAINSVLSQDYPNIEYIVVDGGSTDGTIEVVKKNINSKNIFLSEKDCGIYDALNKGIKLSSGEIIGILHSDDLFCDNSVVTSSINRMLKKNAESASFKRSAIKLKHGNGEILQIKRKFMNCS